jgi:hypothetical protein
MVQVDIPAAFAMGQLLAMVGRKSLKTGQPSVRDRFLVLTNWYTSLILGTTGLFLLVGWPGWETMYQWSWVENPQFKPMVALFYIVFLVLMVILGNAGFLMSYRLIRSNREALAKTILALSVIGTFAPFLIDIKAPFYIGTYQQYHAGQASLIFNSPFICSWFGIMLFWVIGSIVFVRKVYSEDKSNRHQAAL